MCAQTPPPASPSPPRRLGRFEIQSVLGRGGMGTVYLAVDPVIGRRLAIKQILAEDGVDAATRAEQRARFELEFRSAGTLAHPNVVTIYDVGRAEGSYFIAMELVEGESLAGRLRRTPPPGVEEVAELARQIAAGLDYAHERGVVHRDVKPANVLLTPDGRAKITDFGLAKLVSSELTQTGAVLGTPAFMSPEQVQGRRVDGRSDQFSFAVILYLMLTGETPFTSEHPSAILYKIVHEAPTPPGERNRSLPAAVDEVLMRALAKESSERFATCSELAAALAEALGVGFGESTLMGRTSAAARPGERAIDGTLLVPTPTPASLSQRLRVAQASRPSRQRTVLWVALVLVAAGALAFLGGRLMRGERAVPPSVEASGAREPAADAAETAPAAAHPGDPTPGTDGAAETAETTETAPPPPPPPLELEIASEPAGARVVLGGEDTGERTPATLAFEAGSEHALTLELEGYRGAGWRFRLDELSETQRRERRLFFPLEADVPPAVVAVTAPYPVEVSVGGRRSAAAERHELRLPPGEHRLSLVADEVFLRQTKALELKSGERVEVSAPPAVEVSIQAQPANCQVSIDGQVVDYTPIRGRRVAVGRHEILFDWPALGRQKTLEVTISRDRQRIFARPED